MSLRCGSEPPLDVTQQTEEPGGRNPRGGITFTLVIEDLKHKVSCRVNPDDNLWNVKRNLLAATTAKKLADGPNYGFFCPPAAGRIGKYLGETRAVGEFSEKDLTNLQFRYKKRNYKDLPVNLKKLKNINDLAHRKTFVHAINSNRVNDIIKMLKKGHDPNYQEFKTGETPMNMAIHGGASTEILVHLVAGGAHLDYRNTCGETPVHVAAIGGKVEYLKTLLELGASANYRNNENLTALHCLSSGKDMDSLVTCCQLLLENYSVVDVADDTGNTELHHAAKQGRLMLAKKLLIYGANVNRRNNVGNTPLHMAIFNKQEETARKLLIYGADKDLRNRANYDALDAAVTVESAQLAEFIQNFDRSRLVPIKDVPTFHPKRKADSTRRPSMQAFLKDQKAQQVQTLERTANPLSKQFSCPGSNGNPWAPVQTSGLVTPDTGDAEKIGDYISRIFDNIKEEGSIKVTQKERNEPPKNLKLLAPSFEGLKAFSYSDVRRRQDSIVDEFSDSESEAADKTPPPQLRPQPSPSAQIRPVTIYSNPQKQQQQLTSPASSASLLALTLQNRLRQHNSTMALSGQQGSPLPVVKLQPKTSSQQDLKIASIKSSPKRLATGNSVASPEVFTADPRRRPTLEVHPYPATLNPSTVKQRPSLRDVFPFGSSTDLSREGWAGSRVDHLPEIPREASTHFDSDPAGLLRFRLPEIKFRESIYEEIPDVRIEDFADGRDVHGVGVDRPPSTDLGDVEKSDGVLRNSMDYVRRGSPPVASDHEEIYANIGSDGSALSYYHNNEQQQRQQPSLALSVTNATIVASSNSTNVFSNNGYNSNSSSFNNLQQLSRVPRSPAFTPDETDLTGIPEVYANSLAEEVTQVVTRSAMEDLNLRLASSYSSSPAFDGLDSGRDSNDRQIRDSPSQAKHLKRSTEGDSNAGMGNLELERALQNRRKKLEMLQQSDPQLATHHQQQQQHEQQHQQQQQQLGQHRFYNRRARQVETIANQTLPRQKHGATGDRPVSSFFETSQHSLLSLNTSGQESIDVPPRTHLPLPAPSTKPEETLVERSKSVGRLNIPDDEGLQLFPSPPVFIANSASSVVLSNPANAINRSSPSQLSLPQTGMQKSTSCQDVSRNCSTQVGLRTNQPRPSSHYPRVPPKPPQRTTSIPNSSPILSIPPPTLSCHQSDWPRVTVSSVTTPAPINQTPGVDPYQAIARQKGKSAHDVPNRNRNSFESFGVTQEEIRKKMNQLRTSTVEASHGDLHLPQEEVGAPIAFVQGKSKEFNESKAKLERLFGHGSQVQVQAGPSQGVHSRGQPSRDSNTRLAVDETTGRLYLKIGEGDGLQDWTA